METNKHKLFGYSGCLSRETVLAWTENRLSPEETILVNDHLKDCELCRDAIEGFEKSNSQKIRTAFADLNYAMEQRIITSEKKRISRRIQLTLAAAIFLLLTGLFTVFRLLVPEENMQVAQELTQERIVSKDPAPAFDQKTVEPAASAPEPSVQSSTPATKENQPFKSKDKSADIAEMPAEAAPDQEKQSVAEAPAEIHEIAKAEESEAVAYNTPASSAKRRNEPVSARGVRYAEKALAVESKEDSETTFYVVEQPAKFQGGDINRFKAYVEDKLKTSAENKSITGNITVNFTIDKRGKMKDVFVVKGIDAETDSLVKEIVTRSPDWQPANHGGKAVNVSMVLNLTVKL